jgi:hypothetical protein
MESFWEILASAGPVLLGGLGIYVTISPLVKATTKRLFVTALIIIGVFTPYATWRVLHSTTLSMQKTLSEVTGGDSLCYIMARRVLPRHQPDESHFYVMNYSQTPCFNYTAAFRLISAPDDTPEVMIQKGTTNIRTLQLNTVLPGVYDLGIPSEEGEWSIAIFARNGQFVEHLCVLPVNGVLESVILDVGRAFYPVGNPGPEYHMPRAPEAKQCATARRSEPPNNRLQKNALRPRDFFRYLLKP